MASSNLDDMLQLATQAEQEALDLSRMSDLTLYSSDLDSGPLGRLFSDNYRRGILKARLSEENQASKPISPDPSKTVDSDGQHQHSPNSEKTSESTLLPTQGFVELDDEPVQHSPLHSRRPLLSEVDVSPTKLSRALAEVDVSSSHSKAVTPPSVPKTLRRMNVLPHLGELNLSGLSLTSLSGLGQQPNLRVLNLQNNFLSNFDYLNVQMNLQELNVESNLITSFKGLQPQAKLDRLLMQGNPICYHAHYRISAALVLNSHKVVLDGDPFPSEVRIFLVKHKRLGDAVRRGWVFDGRADRTEKELQELFAKVPSGGSTASSGYTTPRSGMTTPRGRTGLALTSPRTVPRRSSAPFGVTATIHNAPFSSSPMGQHTLFRSPGASSAPATPRGRDSGRPTVLASGRAGAGRVRREVEDEVQRARDAVAAARQSPAAAPAASSPAPALSFPATPSSPPAPPSSCWLDPVPEDPQHPLSLAQEPVPFLPPRPLLLSPLRSSSPSPSPAAQQPTPSPTPRLNLSGSSPHGTPNPSKQHPRSSNGHARTPQAPSQTPSPRATPRRPQDERTPQRPASAPFMSPSMVSVCSAEDGSPGPLLKSRGDLVASATSVKDVLRDPTPTLPKRPSLSLPH